MKRMKKLASLVLATIMVLAMAIPAAAAGEGKITMNGTVAGKTYNLYKIFDLTYTGTGTETKVAYTIATKWEAFFGEGGTGSSYIVAKNNETNSLNPILVDGTTKYINITEENAEAFSQAALGYATGRTEDEHVTAEGTTTVVTGLELGYYLIYPVGATDKLESNGCICSLTSTVPNGEVNIKATYPTIEKKDDKISADVGEKVNYTITGKVPDTTGFAAYTYTIKDTMSEGLTFNAEDVTVKILAADTNGDKLLTKNTDYTYEKEGNGFVLTIKVINLQAYVGKTIEVTYAATVNDKAVTQIENNSATLTYSNNPSENTTTETPEMKEKVYSSKIVIDKYANGDTTKEVSWVTDKTAATPKITDDKGAAGFDGLANGTYYLEETEAPEGYNKLDHVIEVDVNSKDAEVANTDSLTVTEPVENKSGSLLPSTGGIGTTIFYVVGGILVVAAAVLLVTRKRMSTEK